MEWELSSTMRLIDDVKIYSGYFCSSSDSTAAQGVRFDDCIELQWKECKLSFLVLKVIYTDWVRRDNMTAPYPTHEWVKWQADIHDNTTLPQIK